MFAAFAEFSGQPLVDEGKAEKSSHIQVCIELKRPMLFAGFQQKHGFIITAESTDDDSGSVAKQKELVFWQQAQV